MGKNLEGTKVRRVKGEGSGWVWTGRCRGPHVIPRSRGTVAQGPCVAVAKKLGGKKGRAQPQTISPLHHLNPNSKAPSYDAFSSLVPDHFRFVAKVWDFPSLCPLINPAAGLARYKTTSQELSAHDQHNFPNKPQTSRCLSSETVSLPRYSLVTRSVRRAASPYPATDGEAH